MESGGLIGLGKQFLKACDGLLGCVARQLTNPRLTNENGRRVGNSSLYPWCLGNGFCGMPSIPNDVRPPKGLLQRFADGLNLSGMSTQDADFYLGLLEDPGQFCPLCPIR